MSASRIPGGSSRPQIVNEGEGAGSGRPLERGRGFRLRLRSHRGAGQAIDTPQEFVECVAGLRRIIDQQMADQRSDDQAQRGYFDSDGREFRPFVLLGHPLSSFLERW